MPVQLSNSFTELAFDTYWFEKNLLGDVVAIYDEAGTRLVTYKYDAWGICTPSVESDATAWQKQIFNTYNPFRYRGYYYDVEMGLYYLQSRYYDPSTGRFIQPGDVSNLNSLGINGNLYSYANNNPIGYSYVNNNSIGYSCENNYIIQNTYRNNVGRINTFANSNLHLNTLVSFTNEVQTNSNSNSFKPLTFTIGLVTPNNPQLPEWAGLSAFYISGHLGLGGGYGKSLVGKGSFGLSFASLDIGVVSMKCDVVTFDEDTSLYLGVGALNANASLGLGFSGSVEIVSFHFGAKFDDISLDGKVYVGWGMSFDFSEGIKVGVAVGWGFEIALNF